MKKRKILLESEPLAKLELRYEKAKESDTLEFEVNKKSGDLRYENNNRNNRRRTSPSQY
jgi:hypothetical protein